jgi:hypothetical protein
MSLTKVSMSMIDGAFYNAVDYGADPTGNADSTSAIQAALDASQNADGMGTAILTQGIYKITAPIEIKRLRSLVGIGSVEIQADFASWTGDNIAIKVIIDDFATALDVFRSMNRSIDNIRIKGLNNTGIVSTAMKFFTSQSISPSSAVNYAYLLSNVNKVWVSQFDTAFDLLECWNTTFTNCRSVRTRRGVVIEGKSVNVFFIGCSFTNLTKDYTSSASLKFGITIDSGFHYAAGAEGRPEGINFQSCLIFDGDENIVLDRGYQITISDCIIDGAGQDCITIGDATAIFISGNYIFTGGSGYAGVKFKATGSADDRVVSVTGNQFTGTASGFGIDFTNSGAVRRGITIENNKFDGWNTGIRCIIGVNYSTITGNFGKSIGNRFIYMENEGLGTVIDKNTCTDSVPVLVLHPNVNANLKIGDNQSPTSKTYFRGYATLLSGTTTVTLANGFNTSELYTRAITTVQPPTGSVGLYTVTPENPTFNNALLTVGSAPATNIKVYYEAIAVPYSATV